MGSNLDLCASIEQINLSTASLKDKLRVYQCTLREIRKLLVDPTVPLSSIGVETLVVIEVDLTEILQGLEDIMEEDSGSKNQIEGLGTIEKDIWEARIALSDAKVQRDRDDFETREVCDAFFRCIYEMYKHLRDALSLLK